MDRNGLEERILDRGRELLGLIDRKKPSVFSGAWWMGKLMTWATRREAMKVRLFRFIESLPRLTTTRALGAALAEQFSDRNEVPTIVRWLARLARLTGRLGLGVAGWVIRRGAHMMASRFIVGAAVEKTMRNLGKLRGRGYAFTLDILGEAVGSDETADRYVGQYLAVLGALAEAQAKWAPLVGVGGAMDWGDSPRVNVSIKPSAMTSHVDPADVEGTATAMCERLRGVYRAVVKQGGAMCIDMEDLPLKKITFELYRRLRSDPEFRHWPHLTLAIQCYLRETDADLDGLLSWARAEGLPISVRLVKGAYWDQEKAIAEAAGVEAPVYTVKAETDAAFERAAETVLANHDICHLACASHNIRSVSAVLETARALGVPESRYEFQILYGMAESHRKAMLEVTPRVRLYCPQGNMIDGMAYLVRRLLENTSNESFLRQETIDAASPERLLASPQSLLTQDDAKTTPPRAPAAGSS